MTLIARRDGDHVRLVRLRGYRRGHGGTESVGGPLDRAAYEQARINRPELPPWDDLPPAA